MLSRNETVMHFLLSRRSKPAKTLSAPIPKKDEILEQVRMSEKRGVAKFECQKNEAWPSSNVRKMRRGEVRMSEK